jgi:hypothetical protein
VSNEQTHAKPPYLPALGCFRVRLHIIVIVVDSRGALSSLGTYM